MRTYVINLEKNADRLREIGTALDSADVAFKRIPAIYGMDLTVEERRRFSLPFRWKCLKGYAMREGELGCALSHRLAYLELIDTQDGCCCVLEDDVRIFDRFKSQLERIERWIDPVKPQVVLLANHTTEIGDDGAIVPLERASFADGYVLTRTAAEVLSRVNYPVSVPADSWTHWRRKGLIELYRAYPAVCDQQWKRKGYVSDIAGDDSKVVSIRKMSAIGKCVWKMKRAFGLALASVMGW